MTRIQSGLNLGKKTIAVQKLVHTIQIEVDVKESPIVAMCERISFVATCMRETVIRTMTVKV